MQRAQHELEALKRELSRIEGSSSVAVVGRGNETGNSGLNNLGRLRDVKYYEFLYELLAKQYELAKIDEAKDAVVIQVVDVAIPPDRKSKPLRALIVVLVGLTVGFVMILWVLIKEWTERAPPQERVNLRTLPSIL